MKNRTDARYLWAKQLLDRVRAGDKSASFEAITKALSITGDLS